MKIALYIVLSFYVLFCLFVGGVVIAAMLAAVIGVGIAIGLWVEKAARRNKRLRSTIKS